MRKIILSIQTSLDGFIEGPKGELDWAMAEDEESWKELFKTLENVDACLLGRVMYPGYEQYWTAVLTNPASVQPFVDRPATANEITYARWAEKTPHFILSKTMEGAAWKNTQIIRDIEDIRKLKEQPGKSIYLVGGATLASSLFNAGLIDEIRIEINPLILGGGKPLFKDVKEQHALRFMGSKTLASGKVSVSYAVPARQV